MSSRISSMIQNVSLDAIVSAVQAASSALMELINRIVNCVTSFFQRKADRVDAEVSLKDKDVGEGVELRQLERLTPDLPSEAPVPAQGLFSFIFNWFG